jgi:hypothetical protein
MMKTMNEKKSFDAVAASRQWKQAVAAEISGMTAVEKVAYFRSHSRILPVVAIHPEPPKVKAKG